MPDRQRPEASLTIDASYIKEQAREAMRTFVAPFSGIYRAATEAPNRKTEGGSRDPRVD